MGEKKRSRGSGLGKGKLGQFVEAVHEDDGARFTESLRPSHGGMTPRRKKPKHNHGYLPD